MRYIPLALAAFAAATLTATAQPAGTPQQTTAVTPADRPGVDMAPPPPPPNTRRGPMGEHAPPPPPPRGAAVRIDRGSDGAFHVDVHCVEHDSTKDCVDIASTLLAKLGNTVKRP